MLSCGHQPNSMINCSCHAGIFYKKWFQHFCHFICNSQFAARNEQQTTFCILLKILKNVHMPNIGIAMFLITQLDFLANMFVNSMWEGPKSCCLYSVYICLTYMTAKGFCWFLFFIIHFGIFCFAKPFAFSQFFCVIVISIFSFFAMHGNMTISQYLNISCQRLC